MTSKLTFWNIFVFYADWKMWNYLIIYSHFLSASSIIIAVESNDFTYATSQQICGLCQYFFNSHILRILTRRKIEIVCRAHRASVDVTSKKSYLEKWKIHRVNNPESESLCVEWSRAYTRLISWLIWNVGVHIGVGLTWRGRCNRPFIEM